MLRCTCVARPDTLGRFDLRHVEPSCERVGRDREIMSGIGRLTIPPPLDARNACRFHEPGNSLLPDPAPLSAKLSVNTRTTVRRAAFAMRPNHRFGELGILEATRTWCSMPRLVETRGRYFEDTTEAADGMLRSLLLDEGVLHRGSLAKNAAAFVNMSRSSRSEAFSRRRRWSSSSTETVLCSGALPNCLRQTPSKDGLTFSSRAIWVSGCARISTRRTASRLNSSL